MEKGRRKKLITDIAKVLAFVLAFFIILGLMSQYVFSGDKAGIRSGLLADAYSFTEDDENTIDIVCMGDSDLYSGYVPTALWESYGFTSTACGSPHQTISDCEMILDTVLETQTPKVAVIECDMLYDGRYIDDTRTVDDNPPLENIKQFFSDYVTPDKFENDIETLFPTFMFHNQWKDMDHDKKNREYSHGYIFNDNVQNLNYSLNMDYTEVRDYPTFEKDQDMREFIEYCQDNGMKVILLELPTLNAWTYARHNAVQDMADEMGVEFIDTNAIFEQLDLSVNTCFRDKGNHINYDAAVKITNYLGDFIKESGYDVTDYRSVPAIADKWNSDVENFKEENHIGTSSSNHKDKENDSDDEKED